MPSVGRILSFAAWYNATRTAWVVVSTRQSSLITSMRCRSLPVKRSGVIKYLFLFIGYPFCPTCKQVDIYSGFGRYLPCLEAYHNSARKSGHRIIGSGKRRVAVVDCGIPYICPKIYRYIYPHDHRHKWVVKRDVW
jgi:hypothetical protein